MKISEHTIIYESEKEPYLINFATGNIDRVGPVLANKTKEAGEKGSFNESTSPFKRKTLYYLQDQNYVTSLTPWEEEREKNRKIEKRRVKAKIQTKRPTILVSSEVGPTWCYSQKENNRLSEEQQLDESPRDRVLTLLRQSLKELDGRKVNELDIWIDLPFYKNTWEDIYSMVKTKGFSVDRLWTATDPGERNEVEKWAKSNLFPSDIELAINTIGDSLGLYRLISPQGKTSQENLFSNRLQSFFEENSAYFLCPFIYNTFFLAGNIVSYCPALLKEELRKDSDFSKENEARFPDLENETSSCKATGNWKLQALCDSTCLRFTETFERKGGSIKERLEKIFLKTLKELKLPLIEEQIGSPEK